MLETMTPLPTRADDPRLEGWYHTIELAPGLVTRGAVYDHRPMVDHVGLPASLEGKRALDVGTADGFWAFEMERRGAAEVVAVELPRLGDSDVVPGILDSLPASWADSESYHRERFATAHAMRGSRVIYQKCSVYNLAPETVGTFDVVYCGSLLVHLFNPLRALISIRKVTRGLAVIETVALHPEHEPVERTFPNQPLVWFGSLTADLEAGGPPGKHCMYWRFTPKALCDMLSYAGFSSVKSNGVYPMTGPGGGNLMVTSVVAHV